MATEDPDEEVCLPASASASVTLTRYYRGFSASSEQPLVFVARKAKKPVAAHRNESWKVAYGDFVTALMAVFAFLWLASSNLASVQAVQGPFKLVNQPSTEEPLSNPNEMYKLQMVLSEAIQRDPTLRRLRNHLAIKVVDDGLRIRFLEKDGVALFGVGRAYPTNAGVTLFVGIARELGKIPNRLTVEGHTDSQLYYGEQYTNWELSTDRANTVRRLMTENGLRSNQVSEVFGSADQYPETRRDPGDSSNRHVTVLVRYRNASPPK